MAAQAMAHRAPAPLGSLRWLIILLLISFAAIAVPVAVTSAHASLHAEADMIRQCSQNPANLLGIWVNSRGERLNCLVRLSDGRVGDYVIQWCKRAGWMEITAYIIGEGDLAAAINVLAAKACSQVWEP